MSSGRYRVETRRAEVDMLPKWGVRVVDTLSGEEVASYPPTFDSEAAAREQGEFEIRNFERRRPGGWDIR